MLTEEKIEKMNSTLEDATNTQAELKSKHDDTRTEIAKLQKKIKSNENANEEMKREIAALNTKLQEIAAEYNPLNQVIKQIEEQLAEDGWNKNLQEMISKQADFYDVAMRELEKMQVDLGETVGDFVEFIEPATACENIRKQISSPSYSQSAVILRSGLDNYERAIRDLCERKLRGQPIELAQGSLPVDRIRDWLRAREVVAYWKKS